MKSIIQKHRKYCFVCQIDNGRALQDHHIFFGTANRKLSEKYGLKVWLCYEHHQGTNGVHGKNGKNLNIKLKKIAQRIFEQKHTREEFISIFGQSYIVQKDKEEE